MRRFDFVAVGVPRSAQTKSAASRGKWINTVHLAARKAWVQIDAPGFEEATVAIVYFYDGDTNIDVDNIAKLVVDGLKGVTFDDDGIVTQVVVRKTNQAVIDQIESPAGILNAYLGQTADFVYVSVTEGPEHGKLPA